MKLPKSRDKDWLLFKKHQVCIRWCIPSTLKIPCDCLSVCSLNFSDKLFLSSFVFLIIDFMLRFILMDYMYKLWTTPPHTLFMHVILGSRVISTHSDFYFAHHFPTSHTNFLWTFYIKGTSLEINPGPHYFHIFCGTSFHKAEHFCTRQDSRALCHPDTQELYYGTRVIMRINVNYCPSY